MRKVQFVSLDRKVDYQNEEALYAKYYLDIQPQKGNSCKDKLYLVVANEYGIPSAFEIGKLVRKYSSGKTQDPVMIVRMSESLKEQELLLNSEGQIENLDTILKKVLANWGYR